MNVKKVMKRMTGVILSLTMIMGSFSVQAADSSVNTTDTAVLSEQEAENPAESGQEILIESEDSQAEETVEPAGETGDQSVADKQEETGETDSDIDVQEPVKNTENQTDTASESEAVSEESEAAEVPQVQAEETEEVSTPHIFYQSQIQTASGEQSEYEKQLAEQEKLLEQIENQIAAAAAAAASADDGDGGASGFLWPCPASHRITSSFGPRTAPVAGASTYHKGIDIGASSGSAIVASAGGRVTTATYSSSAGNYVVVSHGNGISTVYMHASALYVSVGDVVSQGDTIAAVGSTGYSTGPHLHFGVIVNGSYVNPLNYVQ